MWQKIVNNLWVLRNIRKLDVELNEFNKNTYESPSVVKNYADENHLKMLFKPEEVILNILGNRPGRMKMLDIGVGGGRTSYHFSRLTKEYIGVDYSINMVRACRERFRNLRFEVCDAREMKIFEDEEFDIVLFSANGIDYIPHKDRGKALGEIKRVCRKGGVFCFSAHNLQNLDDLFAFRFSLNPLEFLKNIRRFFLLRMTNEPIDVMKKKQYATINTLEFGFKTYYIRPAEQIRQLHKIGFGNIRLFPLNDGKEITSDDSINTVTDNWIYYLCERIKNTDESLG